VQAAGQAVSPPAGDPLFVTSKCCSLYAASMNYGSGPISETASMVGVYRSESRPQPTALGASPPVA
jgi:hypothetical protein